MKPVFAALILLVSFGPRAHAGEPNLDTEIGEYLVPGEAEATRELMRLFSNHMRRQYELPQKPALRAVHAKEHACLRGEFEVFANEDADLNHGVFASPEVYSAFLRYSNGDGPPVADGDKMVSIGMAVKIMNVNLAKLLKNDTENNQDFLLINQPAFLVRDVVQFADLIEAREGGILAQLKFGIFNPGAVLFRRSASPKDNPLNTGFWSGLPFRLGNTAVKYSAQPCHKAAMAEIDRERPGFLGELMKVTAAAQGACFNFFLQKRVLNGRHDSEMPIENARTIWDEVAHPPVRVAQIRIPRQTTDSPEHLKMCERSKFNPWTTTYDFRPLGSLNRVRRPVYELSAKERQRLNP